MSGKEGRRGLAIIGDCVNVSKKVKERLITAANDSSDNISTEIKTAKTTKQKWEEKQMHRNFKQQTD